MRTLWALDGANDVRADPNSESGRAVFATTHWSIVVEAGQSDSPKASEDVSSNLAQFGGHWIRNSQSLKAGVTGALVRTKLKSES